MIMKRISALILAIVLAFGMYVKSEATSIVNSVGDYEYIKLEDGTAKISKYVGHDMELTIPNSLNGVCITSIGDRAFAYCESLSSVIIPEGVANIGRLAFFACDSLTTITLPDTLISIGELAFAFCPLSTITIPNNVTRIGYEAFENSSIVSVTIPDSVIEMGSNPFANCKNLTSINVSDDHPVFELVDNVLFNKINKELVCCPRGLGINQYTIPDGTLSIGGSAFDSCYSLTTITIPESVTYIGDYAFMGCSYLTMDTIPNNITYIGVQAFSGINSLSSVTIPDKVTNIDAYAFSNCKYLTSITIPNNVTQMGANPFNNCRKLLNINISNDHPTYTTVDGVLFNKYEKKLVCYPCAFQEEHYSIPKGFRSIGAYAFDSCPSLTSVTIPDGVTSIERNAFSNCVSLTSVTIPDSVTSIGESAFEKCPNLTLIVPRDSYAKQYAVKNNIAFTEDTNISEHIAFTENTDFTDDAYFADSFTFRNGITFGMSKEEIVQLEAENGQIGEDAWYTVDGMFYYDSIITEDIPVSKFKADIVYLFDNNQMEMAVYNIRRSSKDDEATFNYLERALCSLYGECTLGKLKDIVSIFTTAMYGSLVSEQYDSSLEDLGVVLEWNYDDIVKIYLFQLDTISTGLGIIYLDPEWDFGVLNTTGL